MTTSHPKTGIELNLETSFITNIRQAVENMQYNVSEGITYAIKERNVLKQAPKDRLSLWSAVTCTFGITK